MSGLEKCLSHRTRWKYMPGLALALSKAEKEKGKKKIPCLFLITDVHFYKLGA
jgi:hypothetical protein